MVFRWRISYSGMTSFVNEKRRKSRLSLAHKLKGLRVADEYPAINANRNPKHLKSEQGNRGRHCSINTRLASINAKFNES